VLKKLALSRVQLKPSLLQTIQDLLKILQMLVNSLQTVLVPLTKLVPVRLINIDLIPVTLSQVG